MASAPIQSSKAKLRVIAKAARARAATAVPDAADRVVAPIVGLARGRGAGVVSGYWPIDHELDIRPALAALCAAGFTVVLPVMAGRAAPLIFREWTPNAALSIQCWGIGEPLAEAREARPDMVLVPLLAFDRNGARLGYGGGFYDRTLAGLRADRRPVPFACGIAFADQQVAQVPCDPHDMRLDAVVTERGILTFAAEREAGTEPCG